MKKHVILHLLCLNALEIAEELNTTANLRKSLRTLKNFTYRSVEEFEKTETGGEYQSRCVHNFNVILNAIDEDILLTDIGDFKVER